MKTIPVLQDYPLSQSQLGIYFECMSRDGEVAYNNGLLYRLGPDVDTGRLAVAFEKVIAAHPFVKTRIFVNDNGLPRQRRNDNEPFQLTVERMTTEQFEAQKSQFIQPFHLLSDRLFRIRIIETPQSSYLFMDFHHIIYDGTSLEILFSDLGKAYNGETLQEEAFSGFDVAQEEEQLRTTVAYEDAKSWFQQQFGSLKMDSVPLPDKTETVTAYGSQKLELGVTEQQLREASQRFGVSSGSVLTAAFGYLLGVYTYSDGALFATIYHGRHDARTRRTVSMLVKTLPVYMKWDRQTTVRDLLQTTRQQIQNNRAHDVFSFADLKALNPNISSQVLFAYQGDYDAATAIGDLPFVQVPLMENATGELLAIELSRQKGKLVLRAEFHSNVYSPAYISRLMNSYDQIVRAIVEADDDNTPVSSLTLMPDEDAQMVLKMGRGEEMLYDTSETFVSMFLRQAALTPDAIAIVDKYTSITYHELDCQSDILASSLVDAGVTNDSAVALLFPRRKEFLIAVLAVFKAGGAYVSLDSDYPASRLDFMLNDLNARYLITTSELKETVSTDKFAEGGGLFLLDHFDFSVNASPVNNSRPDSLAYIIYTSGTSGVPKGVMVEHRALRSMLEWVVPMEGLKSGDRCAHHASFSFDASIVDLFAPLTCGAAVHIISSSMRFDMGSVSDYLTNHDIKGLTMSTQVGMELIDNHDPKIHYLFMGGENLHPVRKTSVRQINGYGPTEFTVCSSYHVVDQDVDNDSIPIGRPVPNSTSIVVSTSGTLVPWGAVGELCLTGTQLARGYWQRASQTNEKFVDCPFMPGRKMYHTGDLVRWNPDGELMFMGRIDNQIKLHGYRIELNEIESKINDYPGVQVSAVILSRNNSVEYLTGYYVAETTILPQTLRDSLTAVLPSFMIPSRLIQIDKMPMTLNEKIDRRSLEELTLETQVVPQHVEQPVGPMETMLYDLVKQLLGAVVFGVTDDLTLMGLSSLDAIRLVSMAKKKGIALKVNEIMQGKTIRKIAQQETSIGRWQDGYHADKPVVVAIQGFSPYKVHQYFDALCERFSVFAFTALDDYLADDSSITSKSGVVNRYLEVLETVLPAGIQPVAFVGHCYGGELAYRCAVQWQAKTGQMPKVVLLNTPSRTDEEIRQMMPPQSDIVQMTDEQLQHLNDWRVQHEVVLSLIDGVPFPSYQGEVVFYKAMLPYQEANKLTFDSEGLARQDALYEQRWHSLVPHLKIIPVATDHFSMLEAQYINIYLDSL